MFDPKFKMTRDRAIEFAQKSVAKILNRINQPNQKPTDVAGNPYVIAVFPDGDYRDITPTAGDIANSLQEFMVRCQTAVDCGCEALIASGFSSLREDWRTGDLGTHLFNPGEVFEEGEVVTGDIIESLVDGKAYALSVFVACRDASVQQMVPIQWNKSSQRFSLIDAGDAVRTAIDPGDGDWPARNPDEWLPEPELDLSGLN